MKRKFTNSILASAVAITTCSTSLFAQNVNIPDANFKAYLIGFAAVNTNFDNEIQVSEAAAFTGEFLNFVVQPNISDLTGIEAFTSMTVLDCSNHSITSLDVSAMTALTTLRCQNNNLSSLITGNIGITTIQCFNNSLTDIDISGNTNLISLDASNNQLTNLDLSANTNLAVLKVGDNQLTSLDLSATSNLEELRVQNNQLTSLIFATSINNLGVVTAANNQLTGTLDFSGCPNFWYLGCENNLLSNINVKNGNNLNFEGLDAIGNPNLTCVEVDDAAWSTAASWFNIDPTTVFSEDCAAIASIESFENKSLSVYPNPTSIEITISNIEAGSTVSLVDLSGKMISQTITNSTSLTIPTSDFNAGVYFVRAITENGAVGVERLVVE